MIVIEGRGGKSKILENLLLKDFRTDNVLIIDTIGIKSFLPSNEYEHTILDTNFTYQEVINLFEKEYKTLLNKYDWIAFYVNSDVSSIAAFKELDRKYPQNFIVTIQSNNGLTNTYYV